MALALPLLVVCLLALTLANEIVCEDPAFIDTQQCVDSVVASPSALPAAVLSFIDDAVLTEYMVHVRSLPSPPPPQPSAFPATVTDVKAGTVVLSGSASYRLLQKLDTLGTTGLEVAPYVPPAAATDTPSGELVAWEGVSHSSLLITPAEPAMCLAPPAMGVLVVADKTPAHRLNKRYTLGDRVGHGGHGVVWRAMKLDAEGQPTGETFILKQLFTRAVLSGWREVYFGKRLSHSHHVARFVEHFLRGEELWLVFRDEGLSLTALQYTVGGNGARVASPFWRRLRTDARGPAVFKTLFHQLLQAVADCHALGVIHRDIKPANILLNTNLLKLADLGSAVDEHTMSQLYGSLGPSAAEQSAEYSPPEAVLTAAYDLWSTGLVILELLLAKPPSHLFQIPPRQEARLRHHYPDPDAADRAVKLASYRALCIAHDAEQEPGAVSNAFVRAPPTAEGCNFASFRRLVHGTDEFQQHPLDPAASGGGDPPVESLGVLGEMLLWRLLQFDPARRLGASTALKHHAYFREEGPYTCTLCGAAFDMPHALEGHRCSKVE